MKYTRTSIPEIIICEPKVFGDHRGYFMESYKALSLNDFLGHKIEFCQDNESSSKKGVLRGLHYQIGDFAQTKLVRVVYGKVIDIAVDIRVGSPTFGQHVAIELSAENKKQLLIPKGFAHGYIVLSDTAIFSYKIDTPYSFEHERGIAYDDATLQIDWGLKPSEFILSEKDTLNPTLQEATLFDYNLNYYE
ncbi:dTDP-4-dehydrorhamnose 3,5-epimerase [Wenyingzhuangia sp. 2_MG-2023]|uniref:dTDP-4-dehydrorhamnose 3,5-epimerase n=1 Tax=Wenyingzhuangia sp. 2_MG-2023 TaxID=3062639 RepID=UPI0026E39567|nr:dTDP-4-dehydrorhamnose 3,5-epimerase [Wenyingzhuangia sp. 2_MG-2023]MDO6738435.1 dTDP-4-dehydrorhamnose 3,5-epimerase [Wenyingzhuangia sp. 2_MG-2023]